MTFYVLDNQPLMCQAVASLIRRIDPTKNVIEILIFSKLQSAILINGRPKAFVIDPVMTGIDGTAGIEKIKNNYPSTPLIVFSSIPAAEAKNACILAGADLYIEKNTSTQDVFNLIKNKINLTKKHPSEAQILSNDGFIKLSKRQKQLLILVDSGLSNESIAKKLEISEHTTKVHLWRFYKKMGVSSRTQLLKAARDGGYL